MTVSVVTDILKVYTDVTHLNGPPQNESVIILWLQSFSLFVRTAVHVYATLLFTSLFTYFLNLRSHRDPTAFRHLIVSLIYSLILVRLVLHMLMNPLTAIIIVD